jgi:hypothetical protein
MVIMTTLAARTRTVRAPDEANAERVRDIDLRMPCEWEIKRLQIRDGLALGTNYCDILCNEAIMIGFGQDNYLDRLQENDLCILKLSCRVNM